MSGSKEKESSISQLFVDGVNMGSYRCTSLKEDYNLPSGLNVVPYHFNVKVEESSDDKVFLDRGGKNIQAEVSKAVCDFKCKEVDKKEETKNYVITIGNDKETCIVSSPIEMTENEKNNVSYKLKRIQMGESNQSFDMVANIGKKFITERQYIIPASFIRDSLICIECFENI